MTSRAASTPRSSRTGGYRPRSQDLASARHGADGGGGGARRATAGRRRGRGLLRGVGVPRQHRQARARPSRRRSVTVDDDRLTVEVSDDGVGGAELDGGSGIQGLMDRVGALSGTLGCDEPAGDGTRVTASIPLERGGRRGAGRRAHPEPRAAGRASGTPPTRTALPPARARARGRSAHSDLGADGPRPALDRVAAAPTGADRRPRRVALPHSAATGSFITAARWRSSPSSRSASGWRRARTTSGPRG